MNDLTEIALDALEREESKDAGDEQDTTNDGADEKDTSNAGDGGDNDAEDEDDSESENTDEKDGGESDDDKSDGDDKDECARRAVSMVRNGEADILMKGLINTDNVLRAILHKETGILRPGHVLTHIAMAEIPKYEKLLFFTDAAVIPVPTKEQRRQQVHYVNYVCHALGIEEPRISLIHCAEKVSEKTFPYTVDYLDIIALAQSGYFGRCIIDGPLEPDPRNEAIKRQFPQRYQQLLAEVYPALRHSDYIITYSIHLYTLAESREVYKTHPQDLSLAELTALATEAGLNTPEGRAVIYRAAELLPQNPRALLMAAQAALQVGDYGKAEALLTPLGNSPQRSYLLGAIRKMQQRYDEALHLMQEAHDGGILEATAQTEEINELK